MVWSVNSFAFINAIYKKIKKVLYLQLGGGLSVIAGESHVL